MSRREEGQERSQELELDHTNASISVSACTRGCCKPTSDCCIDSIMVENFRLFQTRMPAVKWRFTLRGCDTIVTAVFAWRLVDKKQLITNRCLEILEFPVQMLKVATHAYFYHVYQEHQ